MVEDLPKITADAEPVVALKNLKFGVVGEGVGQVLTSYSLGISTWTDRGRAIAVPDQSAQHGRLWTYYIVFTEPVPAKSKRTVQIAGGWRDAWRPLRETGSDVGSFTLRSPSDKFDITLIFPTGLQKENVEFEVVSPAGSGTVATQLRRGRVVVTWSIDYAEPGDYAFAIRIHEEGMRHLGWGIRPRQKRTAGV